jgi:NADH-quinone oxidoreductase subunit J
MTAAFLIIAALVVVSAAAAMSLRNLVHCALCLVGALAGLAALYLQLDAQFVGLAQILVYIGAVAILIVFAILLTRNCEPLRQPAVSPSWWMGVAIAVLTFGSLAAMVLSSSVTRRRCCDQEHRHQTDDGLRVAPGSHRAIADRGDDWGGDHRDAGDEEMKLKAQNSKLKTSFKSKAPKSVGWGEVEILKLRFPLSFKLWTLSLALA